jgi:hypothetical protein
MELYLDGVLATVIFSLIIMVLGSHGLAQLQLVVVRPELS